MDVKAAVLFDINQKWEVESVDLDTTLGVGEVLVRVVATGLCHSDDHAVTGDMPVPLPYVGGHEGAGVVEAVGPGVLRVAEGDHVVLAFNPPCGHCHYCAVGKSSLCIMAGNQAVATREHFTARDLQASAAGTLGTFAEYTVVSDVCVIKIEEDIPFAQASLLGCAVTTGWGASVYLAGVRPGDNVVVIGAGGVGVNSLQGAHNAGADIVLAIDPNEYKREQAHKFGATHTAAGIDEAKDLLATLTHGRMADAAIVSVGVGSGELISRAVELTGLDGTTIITSVAPSTSNELPLELMNFTFSQKTLRGNVYGGVNVHRDIPLLLGLYRRGKLNLDDLVSATYSLDDINLGYADMHAGKNLRGVVLHGNS